MRDERLEVSVTFVPAKGYVASAPELRQPVVAVSLGLARARRCAGSLSKRGRGAAGRREDNSSL
jgi:hypothetical protein